MKKILILGTYPIKNPTHGGQLRSEAIYKLYTTFADVRHCAVFNPHGYRKFGKYDIPISEVTLELSTQYPFADDIFCGLALSRDKAVKKKFKQLIADFQPEYIQLEQCFPWLGVRELLQTDDCLNGVQFINSTHNHEYAMKEKIYETMAVPSSLKRRFLDQIQEVETELAQIALLTIVTTKDDQKVFELMGSKNILLAPNGIEKKKVLDAAVNYWKERFLHENARVAIVFVGSKHIPNSQGFNDLVTNKIGFLPANSRIYVAGGVCELLKQGQAKQHVLNTLFDKRVSLLGLLSAEALTSLIYSCQIILLPITQGGGSNLKTAEALLSGKKLVATSKAFRAFEKYAEFPQVAIAENHREFKQAILNQIDSPEPSFTEEQRALLSLVSWDNCLVDLSLRIRELL